MLCAYVAFARDCLSFVIKICSTLLRWLLSQLSSSAPTFAVSSNTTSFSCIIVVVLVTRTVVCVCCGLLTSGDSFQNHPY